MHRRLVARQAVVVARATWYFPLMGVIARLRQRLDRAVRAPAVRELVTWVLLPFVVQRVLLVLVVFFGATLIPNSRGWHAIPQFAMLDGWLRFDSEYYQTIAADGYPVGDLGKTVGFFPFYPWLIRIVAVVMPLPYAALLVANGAAVGAIAVLYGLARELGDEALARRTVWIVLLFPTSFFLTAAYSESTYLLFAGGAVLAWRVRRPWLAALCAAAATMTRPIGVFCFTVPFLAGWLVCRRRLRDLPWLVVGSSVGAGLILLTYYLSTGDPFAFLHAPSVRHLRIFWQKEPVPWLDVLADEGVGRNLMRRLLNWSAVALVGAVTIHLIRRKEIELGLLSLVALGVPLYFHGGAFDAASMARYALAAFPLFIVLARWAPDGLRARGLDLGGQMVQVVLAVLFAGWWWAE